jgi:hypothetical protein
MPQTPEQEYLARRHRKSIERADTAADPAIGRVHRAFAQRYAAKLDSHLDLIRS